MSERQRDRSEQNLPSGISSEMDGGQFRRNLSAEKYALYALSTVVAVSPLIILSLRNSIETLRKSIKRKSKDDNS